MAKKSIAGNPSLDATAPGTSVTIDGVEYNLLFTFGALSIADRKLAAIGQRLNLLDVFDWVGMRASQLQVVFYAAIQASHPKVTFEQVQAMITMKNCASIHEALAGAYMLSMQEPSKEKNEEKIDAD